MRRPKLAMLVVVRQKMSRRSEMVVRNLNRLLLEPYEVASPTTVLPAEDRRAKYVRDQIWRRKTKASLRIGVVDGGATDDCGAFVREDGSLVLDTGPALRDVLVAAAAPRPRVDLILALPAPLRLKRMLPVVAMVGVDHLWLVGTRRVDRTYFGSTLLRGLRRYSGGKESDDDERVRVDDAAGELRGLFVEGAEQSGVTTIPKLTLVTSLPVALDAIDREGGYGLKCAAHPDRGDGYLARDDDNNVDVPIPRPTSIAAAAKAAAKNDPRRGKAVLAVGPDRGFSEPEELLLFQRHGFDLVTLGGGLGCRTLRTDVALVALLAAVHEAVGGGPDDDLPLVRAGAGQG